MPVHASFGSGPFSGRIKYASFLVQRRRGSGSSVSREECPEYSRVLMFRLRSLEYRASRTRLDPGGTPCMTEPDGRASGVRRRNGWTNWALVIKQPNQRHKLPSGSSTVICTEAVSGIVSGQNPSSLNGRLDPVSRRL